MTHGTAGPGAAPGPALRHWTHQEPVSNDDVVGPAPTTCLRPAVPARKANPTVRAAPAGRSGRRPGLLSVDEMPPWLQFNKFLRTGYRPLAGARATAATLLAWHNETVNVWLHLPAAAAAAAAALLPDSLVPTVALRATLAATALVFLLSAAYHQFMPCTRCPAGYARLLGCDIFGALSSITVSGFAVIWYGDRCADPAAVAFAARLLAMSTGLVCLAGVGTGSRVTVGQRVAIFGVHCALRTGLAAWVLWGREVRTGEGGSLPLHVAAFLCLGVGGVVNATRVPERWLPEMRALDFAGNSHNIWHIFCLASGAFTLCACYLEHRLFSSDICS